VLVEGLMVDFIWQPQRLIVELDTYRYHGDRIAFERDHGSTVALEAAGYRVLRPTEDMLVSNPKPFLGLLKRTLRS
jgi:very-short-patch-repair endonuclease